MREDSNISQRIKDLENNIHEDQDLLNDYENKLRYETEPRRLKGYSRDIEKLKKSIKQNEQTIQELKEHPISSESVSQIGPLLASFPSLPPHFIHRPKEIANIENAVLTDVHQRPTVITSTSQTTIQTTTLVGMGGIGKSVIAAAFASATNTRKVFTDGVIWLTIGIKPDLLSNMKIIGLAFDDDPGNYTDLETAKVYLPRILADKMCLIVLDDVWNVTDAAPFRNVLGLDCRLLITTRDRRLVTALDARECSLDVLDDQQALKLLALWADQNVKALPLEAHEVAIECGNLPLALSMIGAMVQGRSERWKNVLKRLHNAELEKIRQQFPDYPYPDLLRAIQVSIEVLEPGIRACYLDFAVFREDTSIPEAVLQTFWTPKGLDELDTQDIVDELMNRSLVRRDEDGNLTLHDLQVDYVKKQADDLQALHNRLLDAYAARCSNGWSTGPNDGYFFEHLSYHLVETARKDELRKLLFDFKWMQAKLDATDVNSLFNDYDYLSDDSNLYLVQGAVRLSSNALAHDKTQLSGQLLGRLQCFSGSDYDDIQSMLEQVREWMGSPWLCPLQSSLTPPGGPLVCTLEGYIDPVNAVAVTMDGRFVVSGSDNQTLRVWDIEKGEMVRTLEGHTKPVNAVAVTMDGRFAVSGSDDRTLKVWNVKKGKTVRTLEGHTGSVRAVAVTMDGRFAVSGSDDRTLKVWDIEKGKTVRTLEGHTRWVSAVAVTMDGRFAVSGSGDWTLRVWDIEKGKTVRTLEGHTRWVSAVAVTMDGRFAVSASYDGTLKVWDIEKGEKVHTLKGHTGSVRTVAVMMDSRFAVSGSGDRTLKVWDIEKGEKVHTLEGHIDPVSAVAVTMDGRFAVSASDDGMLKVWEIKKGEMVRTLEGHTDWINVVAVTMDGRFAVSGSGDRTLKVWDIKKGETVHTLEGHIDWVNAVAVTMDGRFAVSGSSDRTLKVWDIEKGETVHTLQGHTGPVTAVAVTVDGRFAVSASSYGTLKVWDIEKGETVHTLQGHTGPVRAVALTRDGRFAVLASYNRTLKVWDLKTGKLVAGLTGDGPLKTCTISPDGTTIIAGDQHGRVHFLQLK